MFQGERTVLAGILMLGSAFAMSMLAARMVRSGAGDYRFLVWNLFLAWMPFWMALLVERLDHLRRPPASLVAAGAGWLVFFPNAPYIVTDFVHLHQRAGVPLWYDILLLTAFAWNGLLLGFASLRICHRIAARRAGETAGWALAGASVFLAGFGIYLGRFGRWNSWDLLTNPLALLAEVADRFIDPLSHPRTWGVTLVVGAFLMLAYAAVLSLGREPPSRAADELR